MITHLNSKTAALLIIIGISVIACKKKEEPAAPQPTEPAVTCFNSNYNGTYVGSGYIDIGGSVTTYTSGTLTIGKTNCNTANVSLTTISASKNEQITQLTLNSSSGGYDGKLSNGNNTTLVLGSILQANAVGSFTFTGPKQ